MHSIVRITGDAWEQHNFFILARLEGQQGVPLNQAGISTIEYDIWRIGAGLLPGSRETTRSTPINISSGLTLVVADTILDSLQNDRRWTPDNIGYNFEAVMPASTLELIPLGEYDTPRIYEIPFRITLTTGDIFGFAVEIESINLLFGK